MKLKSLFFLIVIIFTLIVLSGCEHMAYKDNPNPPPDPPGPVGRMPADVANKLGFGSAQTDVVLSINKNGKVKAFVRDGVKVQTVDLPIHAGDILALESISIVKTSNPKVCWNTGGGQTCTFYPDP